MDAARLTSAEAMDMPVIDLGCMISTGGEATMPNHQRGRASGSKAVRRYF
jgi:hypothetical protein